MKAGMQKMFEGMTVGWQILAAKNRASEGAIAVAAMAPAAGI